MVPSFLILVEISIMLDLASIKPAFMSVAFALASEPPMWSGLPLPNASSVAPASFMRL
jgi:hypothetical protein